MKNNINNVRYLQNYSKMHHFYVVLLLLFLLPCLNVLSLLLSGVFWPFLWHRLPFWNYLRLVYYMILKSHYQKSTQVENVTHELLFQSIESIIKSVITEQTPILIILLLQYTDLVQRFHIKPFKDSFTF